MNSFEYAAPTSLDEATALLSENPGEVEILAGGTDLVTSLKQQIAAPKRLVSLRNISDLKGIKSGAKSVRIGAMTTLAELIAHPDVNRHFPALVAAVKGIGSAQVTNVGTVGGDLCQRPRCWYYRNGYGFLGQEGETSLVRNGDNRYHAIFGNAGPVLLVNPSSLAPALIALDATVTLVGPKGGKREVSVAKFFPKPKSENERTILKPNEVLTEIQVPIQGLKNAIYEVRHRHGFDWPYVAAAVAFQLKEGKAADARIVLGHVAPVPWAAEKAAKILNGAKVDEASATMSGEGAADGATPLSGNGYKVQMVKAAVKRAILAAAGV